jgi:hypothetical protein
MSRSHTRSPRSRYYARYLAHYTKKNYPVLLLGALFVVGVLLGTLLLRGAEEETLDLLYRLVGGFMESRKDNGLYENFLSAAGSSLLFLGILFICGFCAIAQPLIVLAPLIRGMGFGFSTASLFARYGTSAIGFVGVLVLPGALISTVAILLCCRQSLRLSGTFLASVRPPNRREGEAYSLGNYLLSFAFGAAICLAGAFLEAVLYFLFANSLILG